MTEATVFHEASTGERGGRASGDGGVSTDERHPAGAGTPSAAPRSEVTEAGSDNHVAPGPTSGREEAPAPSQEVRDLQSQSNRLLQELSQRDEEVQRLREGLQNAAMKYRQALMAAYPVIPEELLSGSTVEELEASLERARSAVESVKQKLEEDMARSLSVPAGAPVRRIPDLSGMSPREKIHYGLRSD